MYFRSSLFGGHLALLYSGGIVVQDFFGGIKEQLEIKRLANKTAAGPRKKSIYLIVG
jgi:hypothetical protein